MKNELFNGTRFHAFEQGQRVHVFCKKCKNEFVEFAGNGSRAQYLRVARNMARSHARNQESRCK